ncbi:hypothetical protein [Pseudoduganella namucuonensis]|uniref:Uncharacterized protein n=1 Tax=Pseudoduganella namucuonensis TaxID=1035707 RepID=A0A1I7J4N3_9BURK|nr:hypothetical protein [Pseudoduganella namucuonensis]SFU80130.1 hypothetical protein SAMN05216552_101052 [Pseudoduganella namucuonensis]
MGKVFWAWTILAGLLLARMGYNEIYAPETQSPEITATLLLTGGLLIGLLGATGLVGLLGWIPGPAARLGAKK